MVAWICGLALARPSFTDSDLTAIRDRVAPLVEEVAGRKFTTVPAIDLVSDRDFALLLAREQQGLVYLFHPDTTLEGLYLVGQGARLIAPHVVGKYGLFDQSLHFTSGGITRASAELAAKGTPVEPTVLASCVMAHELTHALQGQSGVFDRVAGFRDEEWFVALNAVAEGQAVAVGEEVCKKLGYEAANQPMEAMLGIGAPHPTVYGLGLAFARAHPDMWAVLAAPPADTRMLFEPEQYATDPPPNCPWPGKLTTAAAQIARSPATPAPSRLGYAALLATVGDTPEHRTLIDRAVAAWQSTARPRLGTVVVERVDFSDATAATAFVDALRESSFDDLAAVLGNEPVTRRAEAVDGFPDVWKDTLSMRDSRVPTIALEVERVVAVRGSSVALATITQADRSDGGVAAAIVAAIAD